MNRFFVAYYTVRSCTIFFSEDSIAVFKSTWMRQATKLYVYRNEDWYLNVYLLGSGPTHMYQTVQAVTINLILEWYRDQCLYLMFKFMVVAAMHAADKLRPIINIVFLGVVSTCVYNLIFIQIPPDLQVSSKMDQALLVLHRQISVETARC